MVARRFAWGDFGPPPKVQLRSRERTFKRGLDLVMSLNQAVTTFLQS